jgi:putative zinc finger/helix-turn-helix YgiT family protein
MNKCHNCKKPMTVSFERHSYVEGGLPHVYIEGFEVRRCSCGEEDFVYRAIESMHHAIANALIRKPHRLSGAEVRFLRKSLGWSGEMFASRMGVTPSQVSRWENEHEPIGAVADRLLRILVVLDTPVSDYSSEMLDAVGSEVAPPSELNVRRVSNRWRAEAAA